MAALPGEQVAQYLYAAGFRGQDLINMVAIGKRESGYNPAAHRTDQDPSAMSGDLGLFQINGVNWPTIQQALGLTSKSQLLDPAINAQAAFVLYSSSGLSPWAAGPGGFQGGGDPLYGTNVTDAARYVSNMGAAPAPGGSVSNTPTTSGAPATDTGPMTIPDDMTMIAVMGGDGVERIYAIKAISPGVHISYSVPFDGTIQFDGSRVQHVTQAQSDATYGRGIAAGDAAELATVTRTFGTFGKMWDSIVGQVMGFSNPAKDDPGVLEVLAEFAGRPDMSEVELQNKLQATSWFQGRTSDELEWNSISEQERKKRLDETGARMVATVWQFAGVEVDTNDPRIANHLEAVASGRLGFGAFTQIVKDQAGDESPWQRQVRDEGEAQRQRPLDIENTAQRIREESERWGVQWSPETVSKWAKDMVEKNVSDEDLNKTLRDQANVLYGSWKPPEVETATAAAPWLETYRRVMETTGNLFTPQVQQALVAGQGVFEFESALKKTDGWLNTKNGRDTISSAVSEMGQRLGFA